MRYFIVLLMSVMTVVGSFAYDFKQDLFYYNILENGNVEVTSGDELYSGDIVVPAYTTYSGKTYKVEGLGEKAFAQCYDLHNVTLSEGIEYIGETAFGWCEGMAGLTIPSSLRFIGSEAFHDCSSDKVYISDLDAFCKMECKAGPFFRNFFENAVLYINGELVTSLTLPDFLTSIPNLIFYGCNSLLEVKIPDSVTRIESFAFHSCENLQKVDLPHSLEYIGYSAFGYCFELNDVIIPASVTGIGAEAFMNCINLTNLSWEGFVEEIPYMCFRSCGLETIELPVGVKTLNSFAFSNCPNLKMVKLPNTVDEIGDRCFEDCPNLEGIYLSTVIPPNIDVWSSEFNAPLFVPGDSRYNYKLLYPSINVNSYDAGIETYQILWNKVVRLNSKRSLGESTLYYLSEGDAIDFSIPMEDNEYAEVTATNGILTAYDDEGRFWRYECGKSPSYISIDKYLKRNKFTLLYPGIASYTMDIPTGQTYTATISNFEGWKINNIRINDDFVFDSFEGSYEIKIPEIDSDVVVSVALEQINDDENDLIAEVSNDTKVFAVSNKIIIQTSDNKSISEVYDVNGYNVYSGDSREIEVDSRVYLVRFAGNTYKLMVK